MSVEHFLDTNVLVYAFDRRDPRKQRLAQALLAAAVETGNGAVSTQVLGEFFRVVTAKIPCPLTVDEARGVVNELAVLPVVEDSVRTVNRAIDAVEEHGLAYWDGLIVAAAEQAGCRVILSEDFAAGRPYLGVEARDPFA